MILAVDDEPIILMGTSALIQSLGMDVVTASGADDALRLLREHDDISILLTDMQMPKHNGVELAKMAREFRPDLKLIFATGQWRVAGDLPAGSTVLQKPFTRDELANALNIAGKLSGAECG